MRVFDSLIETDLSSNDVRRDQCLQVLVLNLAGGLGTDIDLDLLLCSGTCPRAPDVSKKMNGEKEQRDIILLDGAEVIISRSARVHEIAIDIFSNEVEIVVMPFFPRIFRAPRLAFEGLPRRIINRMRINFVGRYKM